MTSIHLDEGRIERLIDLMDRKDKINQEIRVILSGNVFKKTNPKQQPDIAMELDLDISGLFWNRSKRQGGGPADPSDGWAWAFAYTVDGDHRDEARELVQGIQCYGKVEVGGYEITLAGRDNRLLNRKKLKNRSR